MAMPVGMRTGSGPTGNLFIAIFKACVEIKAGGSGSGSKWEFCALTKEGDTNDRMGFALHHPTITERAIAERGAAGFRKPTAPR